MTPSAHNPLARARSIWLNRNEPEYTRAFADLYWRTLMLVAIIILIIAGIYALMFFSSVLAQFDAHASQTKMQGTSSLNEQELQATLNGLTARQSAFQSLQSAGAPRVGDPSAGD